MSKFRVSQVLFAHYTESLVWTWFKPNFLWYCLFLLLLLLYLFHYINWLLRGPAPMGRECAAPRELQRKVWFEFWIKLSVVLFILAAAAATGIAPATFPVPPGLYVHCQWDARQFVPWRPWTDQRETRMIEVIISNDSIAFDSTPSLQAEYVKTSLDLSKNTLLLVFRSKMTRDIVTA